MATFIHIADFKNVPRIRRGGIKCGRQHDGKTGLYCFPVLPDYNATHQWSRELKRSGARSLACIQFKIPDDELVLIGKYLEANKTMVTAAEAIKTLLHHENPWGIEIIIPRKILPGEIAHIYPAPRLAGWRYFPEAKGRKPCPCKYCQSGQIGGRRLMQED